MMMNNQNGDQEEELFFVSGTDAPYSGGVPFSSAMIQGGVFKNPQNERDSSPTQMPILRQSYHAPFTASPAAPMQSGMYKKSGAAGTNSNMPRQQEQVESQKWVKAPMNTAQKGLDVEPRHQLLIDWINSFNDPYCLLVNSFSDLSDGIALCHLVGYVACSQSDQEKIKQLVYYEATPTSRADLALQNLDLSINILKSSNMPLPPETQKIQPNDLITAHNGENNQSMRVFVDTLKSIHEIVSFGVRAPQQLQQVHQSFTPHYTSTQVINNNGGELDQQQNINISSVPSQTNLPKQQQLTQQCATPTLITPRTGPASEAPATRNTHSSQQSEYMGTYQSQQKLVLQQRYNQLGNNSSGQRGQSAPGMAVLDSTDRFNKQENLSMPYIINSDVQSFKENTVPFSQVQLQNTQPFSTQVIHQSNIKMADNGFDQCLDVCSISPIDSKNRKKDVSPNTSRRTAAPRADINQPEQNKQFKNNEELQILSDLSQLDASYNMLKLRQGEISARSNRRNEQVRDSSSEGSKQRKYKMTNSQEQRDRLRKQQLKINNYENILQNASLKLQNSKTIDSEQKMSHAKQRTLEPPQSFFVENPQPQIFSERIAGESNSKHKFQIGRPASRQDDQKSIRFKVDMASERFDTNPTRNGNDYCDEDIMSEMQVLNVRPESKEATNRGGSNHGKTLMFNEIVIAPVELKVKHRILEWLSIEVKLVKNNPSLLEDLPLYCKNGVFLCDLANRLSGRQNTLKGIDRNPKNITHILTNFNKVLDYFRAFPRFCPRYLWAHRYLMDGHADVLWGLLDDIWHWSSNKISPYDPGHEKFQLANSLSPPKALSNKSSNRVQPSMEVQKSLVVGKTQALPPRVSVGQQQKVNQKLDTSKQESHQNKLKRNLAAHTPVKMLSSRNENNSTLGRGGSYSNLHLQAPLQKTPQRTPQKTPQKSALKNISRAIDLPLQQSGSKQQNNRPLSGSTYAGQNSARSKSNHRRNNSGLQGRRRDISGCASPIAKDSMGNLYYMGDSQQNFHTFNGDDRNANTLFASNGNNKQPSQNRVHAYVEVSEEIISEIRKWLFSLNFGSFLSKEFEHRDICTDPFCNGLLLAEVVSYLEKITLFKVIQVPKTIAESRENVMKVLSIIRQRIRDFPLKLLSEQSVENVLKRDRQTIYQILFHLKKSYPEIKSTPNSTLPCSVLNQYLTTTSDSQNAQNLALPYSSAEIKLLEISLLNWLKNMGIFSKLYGSSQLEVSSLLAVQKELSNGILLAEIVSTIFNVKIPGIFKDPKTEATMLSNIRKPLDILRRQGKMSQKFTWTEKELFEGRIPVYLGLLEDLHRCFDGLPQRKRGLNYFADGPYLGDTLYEKVSEQPLSRASLLNSLPNPIQEVKPKAIEDKVPLGMQTQQDLAQKIDGLIEKSKYQELPSIFKNPHHLGKYVESNVHKSTNHLLGQTTLSQDQQVFQNNQEAPICEVPRQPNFSQFLNLKLQKEHQQYSPLRSKPDLRNSNTLGHYLKPTQEPVPSYSPLRKHHFQQVLNDNLHSQRKELAEQYPVPPTRSPLNLNSRCQSFEFDMKSNLKKPCQINMQDYENEEHNMNKFAYKMKVKGKLTEWLKELDIPIPQGFNLDIEPIVFFKDGLFLAEIVSKLEGFQVENIQQNPKSQASCLQNIRKALAVLKKKNQVPLYLLYSEEEIFNGNGEIILELLKSMRQAYKNKTAAARSISSNTRKSKFTQQMTTAATGGGLGSALFSQ